MSTQASTSGPLGQPRGIGFAILLAIVTLGIYTLYWVFKTQDEVKEHSGIGVGGVVGLVIYIVLSPVTWFLIPSDVGKMFKADGREAPFTGWTGLWLLLPIVGAFVWFIKVQGALNRYWESKAQRSVPAGNCPPRASRGTGLFGPVPRYATPASRKARDSFSISRAITRRCTSWVPS